MRSMTPSRTLHFAAACAGAGLALAVCRYVFLPLELPRLTVALLVGGASGLLVTGLQQGRAAWRQGARGGLAAALAAAALVVGAFVAFAPSRHPALTTRALPGLRIDLPAWSAREDSGPTMPGVLTLDDPAGGGRFVSVRWTPGEGLADGQLASTLAGFGRRDATEAPMAVAGQPGRLVRYEDDQGHRALVTAWRCVDNDTHYTLWTFRDGDPEALHRRMLATASCGPVEGVGGPVYPPFTPPDGYGALVTDQPARVWVGPAEDVLVVYPGTPGRDMEGFRQAPALREQLLAALELRDATFEPTPLLRAGPDGTPREIWAAVARDDEGPVRVQVVAWACPGRLFVALHLGEPEAAALAALASGGCP